jgi:hypothetical protein
MVRNLVVSGGPLHDLDATTAALVALGDEVGLSSEVPLDPTGALDVLAEHASWDLVTMNALLWRMLAPRHAHLREAWTYRLDPRHGDALVRHVHEGGGLLACHTAPICFDGAASWRSLLGATWDWQRSHHPPLGPAVVHPTPAAADHPITAGIGSFEVVDEIYADLALDADVEPLLVSVVDGKPQPVLWTRQVGRGRVVVDLLGHHVASTTQPVHAEVLRRSLRWLIPQASAVPSAAREPEAVP